MRPWAAALLLLALAAPFATGGAWAQALPADADRDGVPDGIDACPDSAPYELVDATGCSVCDCDDDATGEPWASRSAYMRCILDELRARRTDNRISRADARLALTAARSSSGGNENKVRCCIMFPGKADGICRVMDELRCDGTTLGASDVEDLDSGSCFPNPCVAQ